MVLVENIRRLFLFTATPRLSYTHVLRCAAVGAEIGGFGDERKVLLKCDVLSSLLLWCVFISYPNCTCFWLPGDKVVFVSNLTWYKYV